MGSASLLQRCLAECLGVYILCAFGNGSVAQSLHYSGGKAGLLDIHLAYGLAVTLAVYAVGKVSGGHINPAITISECVTGNFKWAEAPFYILAQTIGGFISAIVVWIVYIDMETNDDTAGIFATYPREGVSLWQALVDEIIGTIMLVVCLKSITHSANAKPPAGFEPFFVGLTVFTIGASFGVNTGYAINPARDLGPRLFTQIAGWDNSFSRGNDKELVFFGYYFWIPLVGPVLGALIGAFGYKMVVGNVLTQMREEFPKKQTNKNDEELRALNE